MKASTTGGWGPEAIGLFAQATGAALRSEGSLEALFLEGYRAEEETLHGALIRFRDRLLGFLPEGPVDAKIGARHFLSPSGSRERQRVQAAPPVPPVDGAPRRRPGPGAVERTENTPAHHPARHPHRAHRRLLGLTDRKTPDLKMALDITRNLKRIDPDDPVRYDFAISRMGILKHCPSKRDIKLCAGCPLQDACRYWRRLPRRRKDAALQARG